MFFYLKRIRLLLPILFSIAPHQGQDSAYYRYQQQTHYHHSFHRHTLFKIQHVFLQLMPLGNKELFYKFHN